jgi:hypothetical protein
MRMEQKKHHKTLGYIRQVNRFLLKTPEVKDQEIFDVYYLHNYHVRVVQYVGREETKPQGDYSACLPARSCNHKLDDILGERPP